MTVINITVDNEEKSLYVDNRLYSRITAKIIPKIQKKDFDWVWIVDGGEGTGKSVLAMQLGKILDPNLNIDNICMTPNDFTKAILKANKNQCIIYDEAFTGLSSRASLTEINKLLVSLMMEMRQKNLFVIIVMPTFFLLDKYVALFRAKGIFHVYLKRGQRGRWVYFNSKKKKLLYLIGRKLYSYSQPKSNFKGRFYDNYTVNEEEYRAKKKEALHKRSHSTRAETYKMQRDTLFWIITNKIGKTQLQVAQMCKDAGFKIERNSISDAINEINKKMIQEQINDEEGTEVEQKTELESVSDPENAAEDGDVP